MSSSALMKGGITSRPIADEAMAFHSELDYTRSKNEKSKLAPSIYRAGKAPKWIDDEDVDEDEEIKPARSRTSMFAAGAASHAPSSLLGKAPAQIVKEEKAVKFTAQVVTASSSVPQTSSSISGGVSVMDLSALEVPAPEEEDEDMDEVQDRRAKARARMLARESGADEHAAEAGDKKGLKGAAKRGDNEEDEDGEGEGAEGEEEAEDEESEYESESEDESYGRRPMFKPVFVSKKDRATIAEREQLEQKEIDMEKQAVKRTKERKEESKALIIQSLKHEDAEKEASKANASDGEMPDDKDDEDDETELNLWKIRELKRLRRDQSEREKEDISDVDLERRRLMTDKEIELDNAKLGIRKTKGDRGQFRFMQTYFHAGAFFQDEKEKEQVYQRDFTAPTGLDRTTDRSLLPAVLQVKKFGIKGRTKYTHLADQDTTRQASSQWMAGLSGKALKQGGDPGYNKGVIGGDNTTNMNTNVNAAGRNQQYQY